MPHNTDKKVHKGRSVNSNRRDVVRLRKEAKERAVAKEFDAALVILREALRRCLTWTDLEFMTESVWNDMGDIHGELSQPDQEKYCRDKAAECVNCIKERMAEDDAYWWLLEDSGKESN